MKLKIKYFLVLIVALIFAVTPVFAATYLAKDTHFYLQYIDGNSGSSQWPKRATTKISANPNSHTKKVRGCAGIKGSEFKATPYTFATIQSVNMDMTNEVWSNHIHFYQQEGNSTKISVK